MKSHLRKKAKQEEKENVKMIKRERKMILKAINQTNGKRILNGERITLHQATTHPMENTIIVVPKVVTTIIMIIIHLIKILQGHPERREEVQMMKNQNKEDRDMILNKILCPFRFLILESRISFSHSVVIYLGL